LFIFRVLFELGGFVCKKFSSMGDGSLSGSAPLRSMKTNFVYRLVRYSAVSPRRAANHFAAFCLPTLWINCMSRPPLLIR
jgi:hypothetical protein